MSDHVGTTPIIADLKGRRVLVTGDDSIAIGLPVKIVRSLKEEGACANMSALCGHAEGLRHDATCV